MGDPLEHITDLIEAGSLEEALTAIGALPEATVRSEVRRAQCLRGLSRPEARQIIADAVAEAEAEAEAGPLAGALTEQAGHHQDPISAIPILRRAIEQADLSEDAHLRRLTRALLAQRLLTIRDVAAAGQLIEQADAIGGSGPADPWVREAEGRVALAHGETKLAEAAFRRGAAAAAGKPEILASLNTKLAQSLRLQGRADEGLPLVLDAVDSLAGMQGAIFGRARALNEVGESCRALGRFSQAEDAYRHYLDLFEPRDMRAGLMARMNLAMVQLQQGDTTAAKRSLEPLATAPVAGTAIALGIRLGMAVCSAAELEDAAWRTWFPVHLDPARAIIDPDLAWLAQRAAQLAGRGDGVWLGRAARAHRFALAQFQALGRNDDAHAEERALEELAIRGAPTPVGPFGLIRPLGEGSFGTVWLGAHHDGSQVAVKVIGGRVGSTAGIQLANELRAVAALEHPNIVRLLHHGTVDRAATVMQPGLIEDSIWMATELAAGGTLDEQLGRRDFRWIRRVLVSLLDALAHAHARRLLHLDVKPANVLLSDAGSDARVLLADFGLATAIGVGRRDLCGTPEFMAPEQFRPGLRDLGPWTDLYAVGCLAVALVAGAPPFQGSVAELRSRHATAAFAFEPVVSVPDGFESWLQRMLAKDPAMRFRRAADAARALWTLRLTSSSAGGAPQSWAPSDAPTVVLPDPGNETVAFVGPAEPGAAEIPEPRVPVDWRLEQRVAAGLADAGLGLFGLRRFPIVGRTHERSVLWSALRQVHQRGAPQAVVLEAAPGLGAGSLTRWLCERGHETGAATPIDIDDPVPALARHLRVAGLDPRSCANRLRRSLSGMRPGEVELVAAMLLEQSDLDADQRRRLCMRSIAALARQRPVVLRLAPPADIAFLRAALSADAPVLILATCGPGDPPSTLEHSHVFAMPVSALPDADVDALIESRLPSSASLRKWVVETAAGSPRLVEQLLTYLVASDRVVMSDEGCRLRLGTEGDLPSTPEALWRVRIATAMHGSDRAERDALVVAALLGPFVDHSIFEQACTLLGRSCPPTLGARLMDSGLAREVPGGWAFVDPAVTLHVRHRTGPEVLPALHRGCAEASGPSDPAGAAVHWEAAGETTQAVRSLIAASSQATLHGDPVAAETYLSRAETLLDEAVADAGAATQRVRILITRATSLAERGDVAGAQACLKRGFEASKALHTDVLTTRCAAALVDSGLAPPTQWHAWLESMVESDDPRIRPVALASLGRSARDVGNLSLARSLLQSAQACDGNEGPVTRARTRQTLASVAQRLGDLDGARQWLDEAVTICSADGHPLRARLAELGLGDLHRTLGDLDAADACYTDVFEALDVVGSPRAMVAAVNLVLVRWAMGQVDAGDALVREMSGRPLPPDPHLATVVALVALPLAAEDGDDAAFVEVLDTARSGASRVLKAPDAAVCIREAVARAERADRRGRVAQLEGLLAEL